MTGAGGSKGFSRSGGDLVHLGTDVGYTGAPLTNSSIGVLSLHCVKLNSIFKVIFINLLSFLRPSGWSLFTLRNSLAQLLLFFKNEKR